jgi:hypothetical protein
MFSRSVDNPLYFLSQRELFKTHKKKANPVYLKSCEFFGATLIDRTNTLDSGFNFKIIDSIPSLNKPKSFEEICKERAEEILSKTEGKIKLLWSGGIDSTLALVSILKICKNENDLSRINILLSQESIDEYPTFFKDIIENKLTYKLIEGTIYDNIFPQDIIITGEHGDQLFGSDKLKLTIESNDAFSPYENILDFAISRKLGTDKYTQNIIEYMNPLIHKSPFKIYSLFDYLWWMNFSLKWQTVSMRILNGIERGANDLESTVYHFFKSEDFQIWSMTNHDKKIKSDWKSYKYLAKELIYQFHQDENYLKNKEKEPSLKEVIHSKRYFFGLIKEKPSKKIIV